MVSMRGKARTTPSVTCTLWRQPTRRRMSRAPGRPRACVGNPSFRPLDAVKDTARQEQALQLLSRNDFAGASRVLLGLPEHDEYIYHATASVSLAETQQAVDLGGVNGLHTWYRAEDGSPVSAGDRVRATLDADCGFAEGPPSAPGH